MPIQWLSQVNNVELGQTFGSPVLLISYCSIELINFIEIYKIAVQFLQSIFGITKNILAASLNLMKHIVSYLDASLFKTAPYASFDGVDVIYGITKMRESIVFRQDWRGLWRVFDQY
ncbi:MAG: hypothetical protein EZS28_008331 [Streblomastix strix]|uniref:Uncharacterized protein n=1 Tax=Streblomastix strix TaxID=222440 RepID=A0A5J4WMD0_9EUKA|nr:MAG: hypothetical protein EZS28_008331 [Streblomastix strix]